MLKNSKKVISLVLVISLLVSVLAFSSSALADGKTVGVILTPDKDVSTLKTGDTVTMTVSFEVSDFETLFGAMKLLLVYDANVYTPDTSSFELLGDFANFYKKSVPSSLASTSTSNWGKLKDTRLSADEWAKYNKAAVLTFSADTSADWDGDGVNNTNAGGYKMTLDDSIDGNTTKSVDQFKISFKVTGADADIASLSKNIFITDAFGTKVSVQYIKTTTGTKATNLDTSVVDVSLADAIANAPAVELTPLTVSHLKDQIRFDTKANGSYYGTFDYRVIASIDLGDATEADLIMAGFVFNKGEGATIDAAKALEDVKAKSADANATTNYSMTTKAYISTSFKDGEEAVPYAMACVVNNIPDDAKGNTIATVGYVVYELNGEICYALYDVEAVQFSGLYNTYYSQQFGA